jgi:hypothetical protein
MADYTAVYSRRDQITSRTSERYNEDNIEIAQRNIDGMINSVLRAHMGQEDVNGYRILLPLSGTTEKIDDFEKTYQAPMDDDIKLIADSLVIAQLSHDFSENLDRTEPAVQALERYVVEHFGVLTNNLLDLTSDFLRATKLVTTDGKYIEMIGSNQVLEVITE